MAITLNKNRIGAVTSSQIFRLMGTEKVFETYINEKRYEKKLKRSLKIEVNTKSTNWGIALEQWVHDNHLTMSYKLDSNLTLSHPKYKRFAGSPDNVNETEKVCADTKCLEPTKFCQVVDCLIKCIKLGNIALFKKEHPDKYWQLISNSILLIANGTPIEFIESIIYMPYESELDGIREFVANYDWEEPWKYRFIVESPKEELAYLPDDSEYKNINIFRFPLDLNDCFLLEQKIIEAEILINM